MCRSIMCRSSRLTLSCLMPVLQEKHIRDELRKLLPRDDPKAPERPAEEAFRKRMWVGLAEARAMGSWH